jgi:hypothetical protein
MTKRGEPMKKRWPETLNKRMSPKLPVWDLGLVPTPDKPEEFQEFGRNAKRYFERCDEIVNAERERLLAVLLKFLGVPPGDYKSGLLRLAECCVPAFKMAAKRGAKPGRKLVKAAKLLAAVEEKKRSVPNVKNDTEALLLLDPNLKGLKARVKRDTRRKRLSAARGLFKRPAARPSA